MIPVSFEESMNDAGAAGRYAVHPSFVRSFVVVKHPRLKREMTFIVYRIDGKKMNISKGKVDTEQTIINTTRFPIGSYIIKMHEGPEVIALNFMKVP